MAIFLWRSLLIICSVLAGAYVGGWVGATYFVPKGSGLAGGAMVLGYVVLGALGFAIAGATVAFRLQGKRLRSAALSVGVPVLIFYLILTVIALTKAAAELEPDTAFAAAGEFSVTMERVDTSDPYLFVRMDVDSRARTWTQTGPAPEHKVCSAKIKAKHLIEVRDALDNLLLSSVEKLADCSSSDLPVVKRLHWDIIDGRRRAGDSALPEKGFLTINARCQHKHFEIARTLSLIEKISLQAGGKVRCD